MIRDEFILALNNSNQLSKKEKIAVCQHFIDNYPVNFHGMLANVNIQIDGGSEEAVNRAFTTLQGRVNEF